MTTNLYYIYKIHFPQLTKQKFMYTCFQYMHLVHKLKDISHHLNLIN